MTLDQIDARITMLKQVQAQHTANANACQGAIEDCIYWRGVVEAEQARATDEDAAIMAKRFAPELPAPAPVEPEAA